ncbi:MAG TPA: D-alanine--D-alanine ligase family protein [Desulfomonilaceae bacterium]|nr:D-alanine--D-alanine ligase family protein [Desulfomonilaceae bacterium]
MHSAPFRVALIFGGRSAEHEVSLRSASSVFQAMDKSRYEVIPVLITQDAAWFRMPADDSSFRTGVDLSGKAKLLFSPDPAHKGFLVLDGRGGIQPMDADVVFPVLHGTYGEDGTLQGLFELANVPYVGCGVLASAVGMDKILMKAAFKENGLEVGPFFWFLRSDWKRRRSDILKRLQLSTFPVFVKPANLGSSVGITKVADPSGFEAAVHLAASYDRKILVEDGISGRELEVSVLGNDDPVASLPGEVVSHANFYDYEEKYLRDTAELIIPADLLPDVVEAAQDAATGAFKAVDGSGLARVDMFLTADRRIVVNEINTLPGFTSISMYPKLWEATGLPYSQLIDRLVDLALERHREKQTIQTDRQS